MSQLYFEVKGKGWLNVGWEQLQILNCGMDTISSMTAVLRRGPYIKDTYGIVRPKDAYANTIVYTDKEDIIKYVTDNLDNIAEAIHKPMVFMSDRIAGVGYDDAPTFRIADFMVILNKKKYGLLTMSPIACNPVHPGESATMAAIWSPPRNMHWLHSTSLAAMGATWRRRYESLMKKLGKQELRTDRSTGIALLVDNYLKRLYGTKDKKS